MSCKKHPSSGTILMAYGEECDACYCEQFELCPLCGVEWMDHPPEDVDCRKEKSKEGMEKFWICYVAGTDGGKHYCHYSLEEAQNEAERLARLRRGKMVFLLECVGMCCVEPVVVKWEVPK